jgi:hypothetical protein
MIRTVLIYPKTVVLSPGFKHNNKKQLARQLVSGGAVLRCKSASHRLVLARPLNRASEDAKLSS